MITPYPSVSSLAYPKMSNNTYPVNNQFGFRLPTKLAKEFRASLIGADGEERPYSPILVDLVQKHLSGSLVTNDASQLEGAPLLEMPVACGNPLEARQEATTFLLSTHVADEIVFNKDTDFLMRTRGQSMKGRGILDEFVVSMSPLKMGAKPRKGKAALVSFTDNENNVTGTLKTWDGEENGIPRLLDGDGNPFPIPEGTVKITPIAIATGVIGEL